MKPGSIKASPVLLALLITGTACILISWNNQQSKQPFRQYRAANDTIPKEKKTVKEKKVRDLDEALDELDNVDMKAEMEKAQKEIQRAMKEIDGEKIKFQIEQAMKAVDMVSIEKEVREAMANVHFDTEKMQKEVKESLKEVDNEKMKLEIDKALKEADMAKIENEVKESLAKVDWDKMKQQMEDVKKIDMSKIDEEMKKTKQEMEKIGPQLEKEMQKAKVEIEKAKEQMKEYKSFVDGLDQDGLINKHESYSIKLKDGELIINGKKASNETYLKYRSFLEKHPKLNIERNDDDFNINED